MTVWPSRLAFSVCACLCLDSYAPHELLPEVATDFHPSVALGVEICTHLHNKTTLNTKKLEKPIEGKVTSKIVDDKSHTFLALSKYMVRHCHLMSVWRVRIGVPFRLRPRFNYAAIHLFSHGIVLQRWCLILFDIHFDEFWYSLISDVWLSRTQPTWMLSRRWQSHSGFIRGFCHDDVCRCTFMRHINLSAAQVSSARHLNQSGWGIKKN